MSGATDQRLLGASRSLVTFRWAAALFATVQTFTFYKPYPPGMLALACTVIATLVVGNIVFRILLSRPLADRQLRRIAIVGLVFDVLVAQGFVWVFTFDVETAIWAILYVLPLEGAILFQRRGAMAVMAASTVLYTIREAFGTAVYGNPFYATSISFRMGIGFLIAYVAGTTALSLLRERMVVEDANRHLGEMNQSMREFVAIASHDMRTPLSVLNGVTNFLRSQWSSLDDQQKLTMMATIDTQVGNLDRLVNDLLTTSRIDAGSIDRRPAELNVASAVPEALQSAGCPIDFDVKVDTSRFVVCDPDHLRRMVVNLVTNAHKYGQAPYVIRTTARDQFLDIRFEDCGEGVPESFRPRLFDRFARADNHVTESQEGTGLGLAIVKGLAEANGGRVFYEPNQPRGAVFVVRLPTSGAPEAS